MEKQNDQPAADVQNLGAETQPVEPATPALRLHMRVHTLDSLLGNQGKYTILFPVEHPEHNHIGSEEMVSGRLELMIENPDLFVDFLPETEYEVTIQKKG